MGMNTSTGCLTPPEEAFLQALEPANRLSPNLSKQARGR